MNTFVADPHWGWWIVWYFFLGGIAAGSYFLACLIDLFGEPADRPLARVGYLLAAPLVAVCGVLLVLDLNQPLRFWHMLLDAETLRPHIKFDSPMSVGAWVLLVFGFLTALSFAGAAAESNWLGLGRWAGAVRRLHQGVLGRACDVLGVLSGFFIAAYTGTLLTATNQPVWSDSTWIAALFLASSTTTGIAALELGSWVLAVDNPSHEKLDRVDRWAMVLELALILVFLVSLRSLPGDLWAQRPLRLVVVGTLLCGVLVPMGLRYWSRRGGQGARWIAAVLVLAGGFVLRYAVLAAAPAALEESAERGARSSERGARSAERGARSSELGARSGE